MRSGEAPRPPGPKDALLALIFVAYAQRTVDLADLSKQHEEVTTYLRQGLRTLGLTPFVADGIASHGVTSCVKY
ncbi:MAG: hypothetical protein QXQ66_07565 [Candidatus Hadarchaeum sp.]|uniref:hypothetical protein n=1 Tax=Candidatus Hadarchaeum sp. TaxID=2883567 RepID=UPI00317ABF61